MHKIMIGFRVTPKEKKFLLKMASKERRNLSNFLLNAIHTYIEEKHGIEWQEDQED